MQCETALRVDGADKSAVASGVTPLVTILSRFGDTLFDDAELATVRSPFYLASISWCLSFGMTSNGHIAHRQRSEE
jgi:hypothetical protein